MGAMSIVKINAISLPDNVPGAGEELERRFAARKHAIDTQPGFEGFQLLRPVKGEDRYFVVTRWADEESYRAWWAGQGRASHGSTKGEDGQERKPVSQKAELLEFEVVLDSLEP
ncbi:antibiotic biosynthesis monooxygenase [Corynebacterium riegelii]